MAYDTMTMQDKHPKTHFEQYLFIDNEPTERNFYMSHAERDYELVDEVMDIKRRVRKVTHQLHIHY